MERLIDCQQLLNLLVGKVDQLYVRCVMQSGLSVTRHSYKTILPTGAKMWIQTLTTDAFWGHALGKNAYLVHVRPQTNQDRLRGDTFLLRDLLHDVVVRERSSGRSERGVCRDGDPLRLGKLHELGLSTRRVKLDLVDRRDDGRVLQEPVEVAHAPVGNPDSLDLVGVLLVDSLDFLVHVQPVDLPVRLFVL